MNLEFNKLFAALLVAGITASSAAFVSGLVMHPHELEEDAVPIEGVEVVSGGAPAAPVGPDPILHLIAAADVARGEKLSKACAACHSFDKGGPNRVGPNLWNVMGAQKASHDGFAYSDALSEMAGSWGYVEMNKFLYKPKNYVPGTKMNYIGIKKPEDRAAMVAWLRTLADSPAALPSDAEISAEKAELAPEVEEEEEEEEATDTEENVEEGSESSESTNSETSGDETTDAPSEDGIEGGEENQEISPENNVEPEAGDDTDMSLEEKSEEIVETTEEQTSEEKQ